MKTTYIRAFIALSLAGALTACDENSWNNHLDGFEEMENEAIPNVQTLSYTLTAADYATIASNSTNVALAGEEGAAALKALGTLKHFTQDAPASKYVPALLGSSSFPYFTLTNGSAIKVSCMVAQNEPAEYVSAQSFQEFTITPDMYRDEVWGGEDYINAFAPSNTPAQNIPALLLDYVDANDGLNCIVKYEMATQEPVFGGGGEAPAVPVEIFTESFTESLGDFTVENPVLPEALSFVWTWGGANYGAKASAFKDNISYATESWLISPAIELSVYTEPVLAFEHVVNKFPDLAFAKANCTLWARVDGTNTWEQVIIPEYSTNDSWSFVPSGDIDLSAYEGKTIQLGFKYVSEDGKSGTWEVKNLTLTGIESSKKVQARSTVYVPTETLNAVYTYVDNAWKPASQAVALNPADYTAMGQSYANLSAAEPYLSTYLKANYPYAAAGAIKYVYWLKYASGATTYQCSQYTLGEDGSWKLDDFVVEDTYQFVKNDGVWKYSPNVNISLPAGRNQELSTLYYQTIVDWVFENICKPLGDTSIKSGLYYVSSYGNNEYYSGASAYQGNVDLRPGSAQAQYPAEYASMSDDEIVELEKNRFFYETLPAALEIIHADAKPADGVPVVYTINFGVYDGSKTTYYDAVYEVAAPGKFTPVSCSWWENGTGK